MSDVEILKRIDGMHTLTGGRLCALQRNSEESSFTTLPPGNSAEFFVLNKLAHKQSVLPWDPFETASVSENCILQWISEWREISSNSTSDCEVDLSSLLDANLLIQSKSLGKYTFSKPDLYLRIRGIRPQVFISLAWR
mmetsp:Transcript_19592/g.26890  ORF Transcript_19592/g.26890 Transcript_19592/m.26890 type:complete len:138 (-) Transcript_19592:525-938(-)